MEVEGDSLEPVPTSSKADSPVESTSPKEQTIDEVADITPHEDDKQILIDDNSETNNADSLEMAPMEETSALIEDTPETVEQIKPLLTDPIVDQVATSSDNTVAVTVDQCLSHSKTNSDTVHFNREDVVSDTRANRLWIVCQVCKSKILQPNIGVYVERDAELPPLLKKENLNSATQEIPVERVNEFWKIKDMFHFENIGVSKTIGSTKYLLCADCEIGPVGYHIITNPKEFFLAASRVMYAHTV